MSDTRDRSAGVELRWSPVRVAGTVVLGAWAALFWFLLVSGRDAFYLSTRTEWVVPVAAVLLTLATFGRLASARAAQQEPLRSRELGVMIAMVVPVLLITILPPATLGSFSAGKRSAVAGAGFSASAGDIATGDLTLVDVATAQTTPEGERALAKRAGEQVDFIGFVTRYADTPADEFLLTRYVVSCCVADATVAQVRVVNVTPGAFADNEWVEVTGTIYPIGREVIVNASTILDVPRPERPYLSA
ncbi:MAG: TIGR03943 family putative permease subunit [Actinomycetota bacterium]